MAEHARLCVQFNFTNFKQGTCSAHACVKLDAGGDTTGANLRFKKSIFKK